MVLSCLRCMASEEDSGTVMKRSCQPCLHVNRREGRIVRACSWQGKSDAGAALTPRPSRAEGFCSHPCCRALGTPPYPGPACAAVPVCGTAGLAAACRGEGEAAGSGWSAAGRWALLQAPACCRRPLGRSGVSYGVRRCRLGQGLGARALPLGAERRKRACWFPARVPAGKVAVELPGADCVVELLSAPSSPGQNPQQCPVPGQGPSSAAQSISPAAWAGAAVPTLATHPKNPNFGQKCARFVSAEGFVPGQAAPGAVWRGSGSLAGLGAAQPAAVPPCPGDAGDGSGRRLTRGGNRGGDRGGQSREAGPVKCHGQ